VHRLPEIAAEIREADVSLARKGYKTIAVAIRRPPGKDSNEGPMMFAGIVPMLDPPRIDTAETIFRIRSANIDVKMVACCRCVSLLAWWGLSAPVAHLCTDHG
jgi:magnesium-transporting ATPase (P-type)